MWDGFKTLCKETSFAVGILMWACLVLSMIGVLGWGAYKLFEATLTPEQRQAQYQAEQAEKTPHVYSVVDNCTVYIWKNGSYNSYFTKCDNSGKVVTQFSHSEKCGKSCTKKVDEKVETN